MDPALWELLRTGDHLDREEVEAIVRLDRPQAGVAGLRIVSRFGPIATCRLKRDAILQVREEENVLSLKAKRVFAPEIEPEDTDSAGALPLAVIQGDIRRPPGITLTGAGVVIGIVDWGCDFDHPSFKRADGSTRLLALWDQRGTPPSGARSRYGYGIIHTRAQIDRALQSGDPYVALRYHPADADPAGTGAHGTHVMDIAAGNGRGGGPVGVAPEADLIFVHLANKGTSGLANLGDSVRILEAVDFIARAAGSRPWVINLSVGRHGGPHDGKTLIELAFDYVLSAAPNRFICQSAGNYFDRSVHASGRLREGEERTLSMMVDEADYTPNELEVWYSGKDEFAIRAESPTGTLSPWMGLGEDVDLLENGQIVGRLYNRAFDPNNADHQIDGFLYPAAPPGLWQVTIRAVKVVDGSFHAWLERDDACPECQTRFSEADADPFYTTGTLANSRLPLVVGAYDAHSPSREVARFSSAGPTRDNRLKPDLVAPGCQVLAARSAPRGWHTNPGLLVRKSGTSMATPQMTGAVALCLQAARRPLWSHEIRALILSQTEPAADGRQSSLRYGRGYLDITRAVTAASKISSFAIAPSIYQLAGVEGGRHYATGDNMKSYPDTEYFDLLDRAITEPASRAASEKSLLAQVLRASGVPFEPREVDPDKLYRELVSGWNGGRAKTIAEHFTVLARPGEVPQSPPQAGDILLRVALGHPGLGHVAVITDSTLWPDEELASAPFGAERQQPGLYAVVSEAGACPHPRSQPFARRILNALRQMLPGQILIRLKPPNDKSSSFDSQPLAGEWAEESDLFLPGEIQPEEALEEHITEAFESKEDEHLAADAESAWDDVSALQLENPETEEEFGDWEHHFSDTEEVEHAEIGTGDVFYEDASFEDLPGVAYDAQILIQKTGTGTVPAKLALVVHRWEKAESVTIRGARLKIFEIDIGEAGRSDAATVQNDQIAEFILDLAPNPEFVKNPNKAGIPHVSVSNAKWANPTLEKSYKATRRADVILKLGPSAFPLWIPRQDILEEGNAVEIGFVLEDGEGRKIERLSIAGGQVVSVPIPNYLEQMLKILGRFDDPKRDPALEMDGVKFDEFLQGKNRREFIAQWLEQHPALKEAANEPDADLKTSDIIKAWFVIHDVAALSSLKDKHYKANQPGRKSGGVHGFLNRAGYYAATHDFTKNRQGTVYEFLSKNGLKHVNGRTINIETVPDIEAGVPDKADGSHSDPSNAEQYASIGYKVHGKKVTYYKWTKAAFDVLADLYIFASARAGHLLTITVHKEMDRNLARSVIWREYSAEELRAKESNVAELLRKLEEAEKSGEKKKAEELCRSLKPWYLALRSPSDYHGDPPGFNMQALYDLITKKLNALGGKQMPAGARYGIHPRRICKQDGENITNGSHHLHEFPRQSDPVVKIDKGHKKQGWWKHDQAQGEAVEELAESPAIMPHVFSTCSYLKGKTTVALAESPAGEDSPAKASQTTATVPTQPDGTTRVPALDVFSSPKTTATRQATLQYSTEIPRIISKKEVSKDEWWYEIEYLDGAQMRTGWVTAKGIAEIAWPGKFTFLTPGSDSSTSPFEALREAVKGKPVEEKVARSINFINVLLLPDDTATLGDFVRNAYYQALVAAKGNFKEAALILTASIRAFKPDGGGTRFRWVQQIEPKTGLRKAVGFDYNNYADKLWHFFWNAYKRLDGTSARTLDMLGIAYELKSRSSPVWSAITFKDLSRDAKEDIVFNRGGIAFAEWLNNNHPEVTKAHAAAIRDRFLAILRQEPDFNKVSEADKAKVLQNIMKDPQVETELKKLSYTAFAEAAEGIVDNVVKAIAKIK